MTKIRGISEISIPSNRSDPSSYSASCLCLQSTSILSHSNLEVTLVFLHSKNRAGSRGMAETARNPLLNDGSSSSNGGWQKRKTFHRRSDAIAYGTPYQKAAALVDLVCFLSLFYFIFLKSEFLASQGSDSWKLVFFFSFQNCLPATLDLVTF